MDRLNDYKNRVRPFKIIGKSKKEHPMKGLLSVNCQDDQRKNWIILYTPFNTSYPEGLTRLINAIKNSDYHGHLLYYFGGWPNALRGDLVLAHVPYAFQVCLFKEAHRHGFKKFMFLESAIMPVITLNRVFEVIQSKG